MKASMTATAVAHSNIALIKYWGKRYNRLNLPAVGSISVTLDELYTQTQVTFLEELGTDTLRLNGRRATPEETRRVSAFLDHVRRMAGRPLGARVVSKNNFPTGAGLASSASGFAALALAATRALGLELSPAQLSQLARLGSGSAARSIFGGFVEMKCGQASDGSDAHAIQLRDELFWPLEVLVLVTNAGPKPIGSTQAMKHTADTSPYFTAWVENQELDLKAMREAIFNKDFEQLGELSEYSCLKMHALAMSARPGIVYWHGTTVELLHAVRRMRREGHPFYFTIDAGPQVKIIGPPGSGQKMVALFGNFPGVQQTILTGLGPSAHLLEESER